MIKGIVLTLGDGKEYTIPPLTLGALEDHQDAISGVDGELSPAMIKTMIDIAHASLLRNYPDMTRNDVRALLDVENMSEVFVAVMDVSGLRRKALEAGAEPQPGEPKRASRRSRG